MPVCKTTLIDSIEEFAIFIPDSSYTSFIIFICSIEGFPCITCFFTSLTCASKACKGIDCFYNFLITFKKTKFYFANGNCI